MFDWDLFLEICKENNVPLSSEYKVPMLEENGAIREMVPADIQRLLLPAPEAFGYEKEMYSFKGDVTEKKDAQADDLLAA